MCVCVRHRKVEGGNLQRLCVPHFHGLVKGAGDKHARVIGIPLHRLNAEFVDVPTQPEEKDKTALAFGYF